MYVCFLGFSSALVLIVPTFIIKLTSLTHVYLIFLKDMILPLNLWFKLMGEDSDQQISGSIKRETTIKFENNF